MNIKDFLEGKDTASKPIDSLRRVVMNLDAALNAEIENAMATEEEGFEDGDSVMVEDRLGDVRMVFLSYYYSMDDGGFVWIPTYTAIIRMDGKIKYMNASDAEEFIEKMAISFRIDGPDEKK